MNDFFMRKYIYEDMIFFNTYIMHERIFFWKNVFMNAWFVLDLFWFFFWIWMWECIYDVQNSRKIHKRFCECIHRYLQADFVPLKIPAWKSMFLFSFEIFIFLIVMHEWMFKIVIFNFLMICMNVCSTLYFSDFFSMIIYAQMYYFLKEKCINFQKIMCI